MLLIANGKEHVIYDIVNVPISQKGAPDEKALTHTHDHFWPISFDESRSCHCRTYFHASQGRGWLLLPMEKKLEMRDTLRQTSLQLAIHAKIHLHGSLWDLYNLVPSLWFELSPPVCMAYIQKTLLYSLKRTVCYEAKVLGVFGPLALPLSKSLCTRSLPLYLSKLSTKSLLLNLPLRVPHFKNA
ncbi:MAG TPA: hypothetical protein DCE42_14540 [Myxococcales bacterium]|nr:hypothetical protein [Deltaproteobacteria bacterium]MBU54294.1 hypothetical protein [Deltaproteobacteria bacterium]HAA55979.1 hypothetical protein [Myxococcales bacterium]